MSKVLPLQQQFNLRINGVDVTESVKWGVTYEEQADRICTLEFQLEKGSYYLERLRNGHKVEFFGGTMADDNYRLLFRGNIKTIRTRFPDSGALILSVTAYDTSWGQSAREKTTYRYPSKGSKRGWADRDSIRTSELVEGLCNEMGMQVGEIALADGCDKAYTLLKPIDQDYQTDWAFLRKLASWSGCFVWTQVQNSGQALHFVDKGKAADYASKIEFVYPLRDGVNFFYKDALKPNQMLLRSVEVEEDTQAASANKRMVTKFDERTGREVQLISRYDEEKGIVYYYELDEEKIAALRRENPKEADRLLDMGIADIPFEESVKYYREVERVPDHLAVFDKPFLGISVSAEVNLNVNIQSQQSYMIHGISRYSSKDKSSRYLLKSLRHVWDEAGGHTELDFAR